MYLSTSLSEDASTAAAAGSSSSVVDAGLLMECGL